jgi:hypothetical protein
MGDDLIICIRKQHANHMTYSAGQTVPSTAQIRAEGNNTKCVGKKRFYGSISTFRGYRILFPIRNPYINRFTNHFSIQS